MDIQIKTPKDCTDRELEKFLKMVSSCGQVRADGLKERIKRAKLLAFYYIENGLAGIAALKTPDKIYKDHKFKLGGQPERTKDYALEYGWTYTAPQHRGQGICQELTKRLILEVSAKMYAIAEENNKAMHAILSEFGFKRLGNPYPGKISKDLLLLYTTP